MSDLVADLAMQIAQCKAIMANQRAEINRLEADNANLYEALDRSVRLQSHYAWLLNMNDGGSRKQVDGGDAWLKRLHEVDQKGEQSNGLVEKT